MQAAWWFSDLFRDLIGQNDMLLIDDARSESSAEAKRATSRPRFAQTQFLRHTHQPVACPCAVDHQRSRSLSVGL